MRPTQNRISHRYHAPDYILVAVLALIVFLGIILLSSASTVIGYERFGDSNYYLKHQLVYGVLLGAFGFWLAARLDYHLWEKLAVPLLIITIGLLIVVFIPGLGLGLKGANRWINLGGFTLQPAELAKLTFLFYLATWLQKRGEGLKSFSYGFLPFLVLLGLVAGLIILEPDFSTMLVLCFMAVTVFFIAGANLVHVTWLGGASVGLFLLLIKIAPYRAARFTVFLHPEVDPQGIGYHINQALLAIGSGGLFGLGLGHSRQKYNYLPEAAGDSIFAVIAEELGFIFCLFLIVLFVVLMIRGFKIARQAPDAFGKYVAVGIVTWISFQAFFNIAAMVGVVPISGIPLPFISHGSTAIVTSLTAMGVLVNISRQGQAVVSTSRKR
ncbi:MAG: putative lipid II flippase FtsW [Patescibacteria group bacterium]|nr:putative lipid II flippase FtsW [Patescibacteria group bacterium]